MIYYPSVSVDTNKRTVYLYSDGGDKKTVEL